MKEGSRIHLSPIPKRWNAEDLKIFMASVQGEILSAKVKDCYGFVTFKTYERYILTFNTQTLILTIDSTKIGCKRCQARHALYCLLLMPPCSVKITVIIELDDINTCNLTLPLIFNLNLTSQP